MREDIKVIEYESIGSTNAEAKRYAACAESYTPVLFVAKEQSAGRGRLGRSFLSRRDRGIYMSLLYFTQKPLIDAVNVTTAAAVFAARAIEAATGNPTRIKWVNDVYNEGGKVAGILTETVKVGEYVAVIVGIGINVGEDDFPEELRGIASTIGRISEGQKREIVESIADALHVHAENPQSLEYMEEYRARFMLLGEQVDLFSAGEVIARGKVEGVSDDGGLIFRREGSDDAEIIRTGEISVRKRG